MPIGNQNIWDQGIGMAPTQAIFGGQQAAPTNFNPGALGADPNATPVENTTTGGQKQNQNFAKLVTGAEDAGLEYNLPANFSGVFNGIYFINGKKVSKQYFEGQGFGSPQTIGTGTMVTGQSGSTNWHGDQNTNANNASDNWF